MAKSTPIFNFINKDTSFFFKAEERKFKGEIKIRGKEDAEATIEFPDDIIVCLQEVIRRVEKSNSQFSETAVVGKYDDSSRGYKTIATVGLSKGSNNVYSFVVQVVDKGSYEFPIKTVAAISFKGVPLKDEEKSDLGLDKLKQKLASAYDKLMDNCTINTGYQGGYSKGNNTFSQGGSNNTGGQGYKNFTKSEKSY